MSPVIHEVRGAESDLLARLRAHQGDWDFAEGYGYVGDAPSVTRATATAYVRVRCRRCDNCLSYRRRLWTARAIAECRLSSRSWFVTLTFDPQHRWQASARAMQLVRRRRCEAFTSLSPIEQFRAIERETSADVTKWLKRVRKNSAARVRYLLVSEAHEDGFPHYHLLVHQMDDRAITKRVLQAAWSAGFSNAKLISTFDAKAVGYVCKYLSKTAATRVRASQHYGRPSGLALYEAVSSAVRAIGDACNEAMPMWSGEGVFSGRSEAKKVKL